MGPGAVLGGFPFGGMLRQLCERMTSEFLVEAGALDAVETTEHGVLLTDLGTYGVNAFLNAMGIDAPAVEKLSEATGQDVLDLAIQAPEPELLVAEWVATRQPCEAATELVTAAATGGPAHRLVVFAALGSLDTADAEPAVRTALDDPQLTGYAMAWLHERGLPAPHPPPELMLWMLADALATLPQSTADEGGQVGATVTAMLTELGTVQEQADVVLRMAGCGHPDAAAVLETVRVHHPARPVSRAAARALARLRETAPSAVGPAGARTDTAYQLKITLRHVRPPVWRRVVVPGSLTLGALHQVVQTSMGWTDSHLHEFEVAGTRYGAPDPEATGWGEPARSEDEVRLDQIAEEGSTLRYTYDFGDDWRHDVLVEQVRSPQPGERLPLCLGGRRACPPEDVGGALGYAGFLAAYDDPDHEEHDEVRSWAGPYFRPAVFDRDETTMRLQQLR